MKFIYIKNKNKYIKKIAREAFILFFKSLLKNDFYQLKNFVIYIVKQCSKPYKTFYINSKTGWQNSFSCQPAADSHVTRSDFLMTYETTACSDESLCWPA